MHKFPVAPDILQAALRDTEGGPWTVSLTSIRMNEDVFWTAKDGIDAKSADEYPTLMAYMTHLLKSRHPQILPGWSNLPSKRKDEIYGAQRRKLKVSRCWPHSATTGAEYVEACEWYDRVEGMLEGEKRRAARPAARADDRVEAELVKEKVPALPHAELMAALEQATPYELSDVSKVRDLVQPLVPAVVDTVVEVNADNPYLYDIVLSACGHTETVYWAIPDGATGCIGDPFHGELGGSHIIAPEAQQSKPLIHQERIDPTPEMVDQFMETLKDHWRGALGNPGPASVDDLRRGGALEGIPHAPEQPWEKQARVAASAGYAHESSAEPHDEAHLATLRLINVGIDLDPTYGFAHKAPPTPLSGMRSVGGWAVSGFAVTEGREQYGGPEGETGADFQRRKICGPTLEVQDACQRFYDEARQNGDASPRTRRQLAAALERRA